MSHNLCGAKEGNFYIDVDQARILGNCYGVDIYNRLLLDIRGVYDVETLTDDEDEPAPTLERLEMVEKALSTGYAFPTNHYFVTNNLWQEFQEAIQQRKGGFSREQFVHHFFQFAEGNITSWKFWQIAGDDTDMLNK